MKITLECMECGKKFVAEGNADGPTDPITNDPECPECGSTDYEVALDPVAEIEMAKQFGRDAQRANHAPLTDAIRTILAITEDQRSPEAMIAAIRRVAQKTLDREVEKYGALLDLPPYMIADILKEEKGSQ